MDIKTFQIFSNDDSWLLHDSLAMDVSVKNLIVRANEILKYRFEVARPQEREWELREKRD